MVNEAHKIHGTYPVATAALGRLLTGAALMGATLKNESDSITLQIRGDGPLGALTAVTDSRSHVRGCVDDPLVERPLNAKGKLDVGGGVGHGTLSVIRDLGLKEPYIGQVPLVSGEIAEDLTAYFASVSSTHLLKACARDSKGYRRGYPLAGYRAYGHELKLKWGGAPHGSYG